MNKRIKDIETIVKNKKIKAFGVDIELTDEQIREFEKMIEPKYKNPYERVGLEEEYYVILKPYGSDFKVITYIERNDNTDNNYYNSGNYYNNREVAEQVAMELNLQQKLRKFTYDNGWSDELWEVTCKPKYFVYLNADSNVFEIYTDFCVKGQEVYFKTEGIAQRAIDEIIIPFMKENPTFKW